MTNPDRAEVMEIASEVGIPVDGDSYLIATPDELHAFFSRAYELGRESGIMEAADECERMVMYPGGRQESAAHDGVWNAAKAIRALLNKPKDKTT